MASSHAANLAAAVHNTTAAAAGTDALQLQRANPHLIRQCISVVGERIVYELRGIPTLGLEKVSRKKTITVSRSFRKMVEDLPSLKEALANYISRAAEKLRDQKHPQI